MLYFSSLVYTMIDKIDNTLLSLVQKTAEKREDITGKHKVSLEKILYWWSSLFFSASIVGGDFDIFHIPMILGGLYCMKMPPPSSQLGLLPPLLYLWSLTLGISMCTSDLYDLFSSNIEDVAKSISSSESSIWQLMAVIWFYFSRIDTKWPPKKSKLAKLKEKVVGVLWWGSLQPIPIKT